MSLPIKSDALEVVSGGAANPSVTSGTADPTLGLSRPEGSIYLRYVISGGQAFVKFGPLNTDWNVIATGGGGIGGSLDAAYDYSGAGLGRTITADSGALQIDAFTTNTQAALTINRQPGGAAAAVGIDLVLSGNLNSSGVGIQIADAGAGTSLKVTKSNAGSVYFADLTNAGAKALEVVVTAAPTSVSPISVVANTTGTTAALVSVSKIPGATTAGAAISVSMGANTTGAGILISQAGTGAALEISAGSIQIANSAAAVSPASQGRLRYNSTTQTFQVSMNGGAYVDITTGASFTLDIGDAIGSSTVGSVLFVGAGNVLQQDNANFFWDNTSKSLVVGAAGITKTGFLNEFTKNAANGLTISSYGTGTTSELMLFHGRGTGASTTAVLSSDVLGQLAYTGATTSTLYFSGALVRALATENWSGTAAGTKVEFYTTPNTTAVRGLRATIDQDGVFYIEGGGLISKVTNSSAGFFNSAMFPAGGASQSFTQADRELRVQTGSNSGGQRQQYLTFNGRWSGNIDSPTLTQGLYDRTCGIEFNAAADSLGPNPNSSINFFVNTGTKGTGGEFTVTPTRAMTITYTARVGIGQVNPSQPFDVETILGNTNAKFGSAMPLYIISNDPNIGFNSYYNSGYKFGKGSVSKHAGVFGFTPSTGSLDYSVSTAVGSADAAVTLATRFSISQPGVATFSGVAATNSLILTTGNGLLSNGQLQVTRDHVTDGQIFVQGSNAGNAQPSAIGFLNQAGSFRSYVGYFPSTYAFTYLRLKNGFFAQTGEDFVHADATNSTVVINHANRRVGVGAGLASPLYTLDLRSGSTASRVHFSPGATDDGGYLISGQASQALISGGAHYDGAGWINKATSMSALDCVLGEHLFYNGTGLTIGAAGSYVMRMKIYAAGGVEISNSDSATVSIASAGKIRYTTSGQKFQVSTNGGAYVDLATGSGMVIGGTVTSGTTASILFIGAGPVLAQNNAAFNWDNTNLRINVVQTAADPLDGGGAITLQNTLNTSLSQITWRDNTGTFKAALGYRNLSHPAKPNEHFIYTNTGVPFRLETNLGGFYWMNTADGGYEISASTSAVSAANTGRLRYNSTGQKFQVSTNGTAYVDLATGGGTGMAIGNAITSATAGSVLFAGAAGILQQDNANFFWDDTNNRLGIGTNVPSLALEVITNSVANSTVMVKNTNAAGFSTIDFWNASSFKFAVGHDNSANKTYLYAPDTDLTVQGESGVVKFIFGLASANSAFVNFNAGQSSAVSPSNQGRIIYNATGQKFQVSHNAGAYQDVVTRAVERLSVDGAADPELSTTFVSGTGTDLTLANGTKDGFIKNFVVTGGTGTITPANLADGNVLTWSATPANVSFIWDASGATWHVYGNPYNMVTT